MYLNLRNPEEESSRWNQTDGPNCIEGDSSPTKLFCSCSPKRLEFGLVPLSKINKYKGKLTVIVESSKSLWCWLLFPLSSYFQNWQKVFSLRWWVWQMPFIMTLEGTRSKYRLINLRRKTPPVTKKNKAMKMRVINFLKPIMEWCMATCMHDVSKHIFA